MPSLAQIVSLIAIAAFSGLAAGECKFVKTADWPVDASGGFLVLLGLDFLRAHRVLVSNSQRRIYFTYTGGRVLDNPR